MNPVNKQYNLNTDLYDLVNHILTSIHKKINIVDRLKHPFYQQFSGSQIEGNNELSHRITIFNKKMNNNIRRNNLSSLRKKIKTKMTNEEINQQIQQMREEWQRDI